MATIRPAELSYSLDRTGHGVTSCAVRRQLAAGYQYPPPNTPNCVLRSEEVWTYIFVPLVQASCGAGRERHPGQGLAAAHYTYQITPHQPYFLAAHPAATFTASYAHRRLTARIMLLVPHLLRALSHRFTRSCCRGHPGFIFSARRTNRSTMGYWNSGRTSLQSGSSLPFWKSRSAICMPVERAPVSHSLILLLQTPPLHVQSTPPAVSPSHADAGPHYGEVRLPSGFNIS